MSDAFELELNDDLIPITNDSYIVSICAAYKRALERKTGQVCNLIKLVQKDLKSDIDSLTKSLKDDVNDLAKSLKDDMGGLTKSIDGCNTTTTKLSKSLDSSQEVCDELLKDLSSVSSDDLIEDLSEIGKSVSDIDDKLTTIKVDLSLNFDDKLTAIKNDLSLVETSVSTVNEDCSSFDDKLIAIKDNLSLVETSVSTVNGDCSTLKDEMSSGLVDYSTQFAIVSKKIADLNSSIGTLDSMGDSSLQQSVITLNGIVMSVLTGVASYREDIKAQQGFITQAMTNLSSSYDEWVQVAVKNAKITSDVGLALTAMNSQLPNLEQHEETILEILSYLDEALPSVERCFSIIVQLQSILPDMQAANEVLEQFKAQSQEQMLVNKSNAVINAVNAVNSITDTVLKNKTRKW